MVITYTSILGGSQSLEANVIETPSRKAVGREHMTQDGTALEVVLFRLERDLDFRLGPVPVTDEAQWDDFEESVAAGQPFEIDVAGTIATPDAPFTTQMRFNTFRQERFGSAYFYYTFKVRRP